MPKRGRDYYCSVCIRMFPNREQFAEHHRIFHDEAGSESRRHRGGGDDEGCDSDEPLNLTYGGGAFDRRKDGGDGRVDERESRKSSSPNTAEAVPVRTSGSNHEASSVEPSTSKGVVAHQRRYRCGFCSSTFSRLNLLRRHIKAKHESMPRFSEKCRQCGMLFSEHAAYEKHLSSCRNNGRFHLRDSACSGRIRLYTKTISEKSGSSLNRVMALQRRNILHLIAKQVKIHGGIGFSVIIYGTFRKEGSEPGEPDDLIDLPVRSRRSSVNVMTDVEELKRILTEHLGQLMSRITELQLRGSGWAVLKFTHVQVEIIADNAIRGGCIRGFVPPAYVRRGCAPFLNQEHGDFRCFFYSLAACILNLERTATGVDGADFVGDDDDDDVDGDDDDEVVDNLNFSLPSYRQWIAANLKNGDDPAKNKPIGLRQIKKIVQDNEHLNIKIHIYVETAVDHTIINVGNYGHGDRSIMMFIDESMGNGTMDVEEPFVDDVEEYDDDDEEERVQRPGSLRNPTDNGDVNNGDSFSSPYLSGVTLGEYELSSSDSSDDDDEEFEDEGDGDGRFARPWDELRRGSDGTDRQQVGSSGNERPPTYAERNNRIEPRTRRTQEEARALGVPRNGFPHYIGIFDLRSFLRCKKKGSWPCRYCLALFYTQDRLNDHERLCVRRDSADHTPKIEFLTEPIEFKNFEAKLMKRYVLFFDFETCARKRDIVESIDGLNREVGGPFVGFGTEVDPKHAFKAVAYAIVVLRDGVLYKKYYHASDSGVVRHFIERVFKIKEKIKKQSSKKQPMFGEPERPIDITDHTCHICEKTFEQDADYVFDHCHVTGNYFS